MIYPYYCEHCDLESDVVKPMHDSGREERCLHCGKVLVRIYTPPAAIVGAKVQNAEYNPGLGMIVKNKQHREEICKRKNLIEVGNEPVEKIHKQFDKERKDRRKKRWSDA